MSFQPVYFHAPAAAAEQPPTLNMKHGQRSFMIHGVKDVNALEVQSPNLEFQLLKNSDVDGQYRVDFQPRGDEHTVDVKYHGEHLEGSPFQLKPMAAAGKPSIDMSSGSKSFLINGAFNQNALEIRGNHGVGFDVYANKEIPGQYRVDFSPQASGEHQFDVTYNGEHVEGSPFQVKPVAALPAPVMSMSPDRKVMSFQHVPHAKQKLEIDSTAAYQMFEDKQDPNTAHVLLETGDQNVHRVKASYNGKEIEGANFFLAPKDMKPRIENSQKMQNQAVPQDAVEELNGSIGRLAITNTVPAVHQGNVVMSHEPQTGAYARPGQAYPPRQTMYPPPPALGAVQTGRSADAHPIYGEPVYRYTPPGRVSQAPRASYY